MCVGWDAVSRYLFKFQKLGEMRFISHLDIQRLFKRALRRSEIKLLYSQGYNPHPKISIIQPLSLGFESLSDYFEIETFEEQNIPSMISNLNEALPSGIAFTAGKQLSSTGKSLSSIVDFALYKAFLPYQNIENANEKLKQFVSQNQIMVNKYSKKAKKTVENDVKNFIRHITIERICEDGLQLNLLLRSANNESLNPTYVLESFCKFSNEVFIKENCHIVRQDLFFIKEEELVSLFEYHIA